MMLRTLLESQARPTRRLGGTVVSAVIHTAIIGAAIAATANATSTTRSEPLLDPPILVTPTVRPPAPDHTSHSSSGTGPWRPPVITETLFPPIVFADSFPAPDLGRITDARDFASTRIADSSAFGGRGGGALGSPTDGGVFTTAMVERTATPRPDNPAPAYPASLRAASLEGSVVARFVVDTVGRAEPRSIVFPEATHPLFAEAVRQALLRSRYLPATIAGRPVRQLVEQRFAFTLTR